MSAKLPLTHPSLGTPRLPAVRLLATAAPLALVVFSSAQTGTWIGTNGATWDTSASNWSGVSGTPWGGGDTCRAIWLDVLPDHWRENTAAAVLVDD